MWRTFTETVNAGDDLSLVNECSIGFSSAYLALYTACTLYRVHVGLRYICMAP